MCDQSEREVSNPWVIGHEKVIDGMMSVNEAVNERNECMVTLNERRSKTRVARNARRRGDVWTVALEERLAEAKTQVRNARKEVRKFLVRLEEMLGG